MTCRGIGNLYYIDRNRLRVLIKVNPIRLHTSLLITYSLGL